MTDSAPLSSCQTKRASLLVLLCVLLAAPASAGAQGFIIPELGARKNGTGAAIGRPDDLSAIYHNPAALANLRGTRVALSAGLAFLQTNIRLAPWKGSDKYLTEPVDKDGYFPLQDPAVFAPIPMLGVSTNLWSDKLVGAIAVYVPNAAGASFGEDKPSRYHIIDAYVIAAYFTMALAYRPFDWLAVGVGGSAVYIRINRRSLLYPVINGVDYSGLIGSKTEIEITGEDVQPAFNLGIQLWPHKTLSIGLLMMTRYDVSLEGPLTLTPGEDALDQVRTPEFTENQHRTEMVAPWVFGFGVNWDITPWLELGAEFRYYVNSQVTEQRTILTEGEVLPTLLRDGIVTPKNLRDSFHTGAGVIVRPPLPLDLDLMTGYHYEKASSPDKTVEVSAPSFDIVSYHVGGRWNYKDRFSLSLIYSHYWYLERTTTDSITSPPTNFVGSAYTNQLTLVFEVRVADGIGVGG